jgi:hypothetical protein
MYEPKGGSMEFQTFIYTIAGALFRFGLPALLTGLVVYWLSKLDERWEQESERERSLMPSLDRRPKNSGCWEINGCSPENRGRCAAFAHPETPCWQVFRETNGRLQDKCLLCKVFRAAPVPVSS